MFNPNRKFYKNVYASNTVQSMQNITGVGIQIPSLKLDCSYKYDYKPNKNGICNCKFQNIRKY
jgi:hypothetical protein